MLSLGFSVYKNMSPANRDHFTSILICMSFISLSYLTALSGTSSTVPNYSGESEHPFLVPDLRGNTFSFSPLHMISTTDFEACVSLQF